MTPKEKAKQLVDNMMPFVYIDKSIGQYFNGKHCALIAVDEILETTKVKWATQRKLPNGEWRLWKGVTYKKYWLEVKQEIEKL